jgi:hypothetical protein
MADFTDNNIPDSQTALGPTLDAMASILPLIGKSQPARFSPELNKRWQSACSDARTTTSRSWCHAAPGAASTALQRWTR